MEKKELKTVDIQAAKSFFGEVSKYIAKNPVKVLSNQVTGDDMNKIPGYYEKCIISETKECPGFRSKIKPCHDCNPASTSLLGLAELASKTGFTKTSTLNGNGLETYPDLGTINTILHKGENTIIMEIDGDKGGKVSLSLSPYRRPE